MNLPQSSLQSSSVSHAFSWRDPILNLAYVASITGAFSGIFWLAATIWAVYALDLVEKSKIPGSLLLFFPASLLVVCVLTTVALRGPYVALHERRQKHSPKSRRARLGDISLMAGLFLSVALMVSVQTFLAEGFEPLTTSINRTEVLLSEFRKAGLSPTSSTDPDFDGAGRLKSEVSTTRCARGNALGEVLMINANDGGRIIDIASAKVALSSRFRAGCIDEAAYRAGVASLDSAIAAQRAIPRPSNVYPGLNMQNAYGALISSPDKVCQDLLARLTLEQVQKPDAATLARQCTTWTKGAPTGPASGWRLPPSA